MATSCTRRAAARSCQVQRCFGRVNFRVYGASSFPRNVFCRCSSCTSVQRPQCGVLFRAFCRHICRTHLFAVLAKASFSKAVFCSCSSCTSRQRPQSAMGSSKQKRKPTARHSETWRASSTGGLRRGSLLLDIPQQLSMSFPPSPSCEAPRSRSPVSLAVRLTGGLPCLLKSSARRHSKFTKLMRTWPPKQASRQGREQAGLLRVQLLLLPLVCSTPACVFVRSTVFAFCALLSARIPSAAGEGLGCFRFHPSCPSCFVEASERSVSPGVSLFCALQVAVAFI